MEMKNAYLRQKGADPLGRQGEKLRRCYGGVVYYII